MLLHKTCYLYYELAPPYVLLPFHNGICNSRTIALLRIPLPKWGVHCAHTVGHPVNNVFVLFATHSFTNSTVTKSDCIDREKNVIKISGYFFAKRSIVKSRKQSRESEWDWAELGKLDCSQAVTAARCNLHLEPVRPKKSSESILSKNSLLILWELLLTCICSVV